MINLSVVICTHNPCMEYLIRGLNALKEQTLPNSEWELLIIDNGSKEQLASLIDLTWHPHSRVIREDKLGLTYARIRGINESTGELIIFVDDDNVLTSEYLRNAIILSEKHPYIGVFGGNIEIVSEIKVSESILPYIGYLGIKSVENTKWGYENPTSIQDYYPLGAGMVLRRNVGSAYVSRSLVSNNLITDRRGTSLEGAGDFDIVFTAMNHGYGVGVFESLKLMHLIGEKRLSQNYILKLIESTVYSCEVLFYKWNKSYIPKVYTLSLWDRIIDCYVNFRYYFQQKKIEPLKFSRMVRKSIFKGSSRAYKMIRELQ